jgi:hypothetical protein
MSTTHVAAPAPAAVAAASAASIVAVAAVAMSAAEACEGGGAGVRAVRGERGRPAVAGAAESARAPETQPLRTHLLLDEDALRDHLLLLGEAHLPRRGEDAHLELRAELRLQHGERGPRCRARRREHDVELGFGFE